MLRLLRIALLALSLFAVSCAWQHVPFEANAASISDPVAEIQTLVNMRPIPPVRVEVTDKYLKEIWAGPNGVNTAIVFFQKAEFRIITRSNIYQVSAYDANGREIWSFRPASRDLATCQQMINAISAVAKRAPTPAAPPGATH